MNSTVSLNKEGEQNKEERQNKTQASSTLVNDVAKATETEKTTKTVKTPDTVIATKTAKTTETAEPIEIEETAETSNITDASDKENLEWIEIRTEHIVQDEWIDFRRSTYQFPDGRVFEPFYSYSRRNYVVIVASDEEGKYLCVRQFRQGIKEVTTEFPAGGIERTDGKEYGAGRDLSASEDALEAAKRELLEETGYVSDHWRYLLAVPSNATIADNYAYIFEAKNCRKSGGQKLDETEFLHVKKYTAAELEEMIYKGDFPQAVHIMAWLLAQRL